MQLVGYIEGYMSVLDKLKLVFFFTVKNKLTPTVISIIAGSVFHHFNQEQKQEYIKGLQELKETVSSIVYSDGVKQQHLIEREKSFLAIYDRHCKQFEAKTGLGCATGEPVK